MPPVLGLGTSVRGAAMESVDHIEGLQPDDGLNVTRFEGEDFLVVGDRCVALLRRGAFALFKAAADPT
jgi:hypothetical protein